MYSEYVYMLIKATISCLSPLSFEFGSYKPRPEAFTYLQL
jgi:hypothetical protein